MTASHNNPIEGSSTMEGLPKSFVCSMRTLFDIMDDQQTGYVRFSEIERRWHEDGTQGLPEGVLSNLRKVTPPNGYLSFDRFCAGLKMCLLKSKEKDETSVPSLLRSIHSSSLSPTNSLEVIPPLKASSPQTSPHKHNRPLSAPLLDQDIYSSQPLSNGNHYNDMNENRRISEKAHHFQNDFTNNHYKQYASSHNQHSGNIIYGTKSDIRMGVGGIKGLGKGPPNSYHAPSSSISSTSSGPPKPPRIQDTNEYIPQRSAMPSRMTNSLERESRSEKRWSRERENSSKDTTTRKDRGGSLERLLDSEGHKFQGENANYGPPLNRTGMRSALQTWFKERSKSDLQKLNKENKDRNGNNNRFIGNTSKDQRIPPSYEVAIEKVYRGNADGSNQNRSSSIGTRISHIGRKAPLSSQSNSNVRVPPPTPQHVSYGNSNTNYNDKIYGKTMETVVAVPTTYISNTNGERIESISTNGPTTHGLYVAPQPPQLAVHKKTNKKKEPRRHTLQNGVDQNVMKRVRQLEAERDMLFQGLDVVERAKVWYKMQLQNISERLHYLPFGQTNSQEPSLESQQEKLHFQLARIHEINAHLRALMDAQEKGLPAHMNLAIRGSFNSYENDSEKQKALDRLKQQNKLLTEEVSGKSDRITNLEREKAALLRELFQARASHRPANADSTFM